MHLARPNRSPVARNGLEDFAEGLGMAGRHDPGRAQPRLNQAADVGIETVGVEPGWPDPGHCDLGRVNVDDKRGTHERRDEHANVAMAYPAPAANAPAAVPVSEGVIKR